MEEILKVDNLSFGYPDGQQALADISLTVCRGETVALIGPIMATRLLPALTTGARLIVSRLQT